MDDVYFKWCHLDGSIEKYMLQTDLLLFIISINFDSYENYSSTEFN